MFTLTERPALPRYSPRQPQMTQLYPLLDALDSFTDEIHRASPTTCIIGLYIQGLGRSFTSIRAWLEALQEGDQVEEGSRRMKDCLARVLVHGHKRLGLKALERWFVVSEEGDRLVESRRREEAEKRWQASEKEWSGLIDSVEVSMMNGITYQSKSWLVVLMQGHTCVIDNTTIVGFRRRFFDIQHDGQPIRVLTLRIPHPPHLPRPDFPHSNSDRQSRG